MDWILVILVICVFSKPIRVLFLYTGVMTLPVLALVFAFYDISFSAIIGLIALAFALALNLILPKEN